MKYLVGDRVKIRTWEDMEQEYGLNAKGNINNPQGDYVFSKEKEAFINRCYSNRTFTIFHINDYERNDSNDTSYETEKSDYWQIEDWMIKYLAEPIYSRFEILDI